MLHVALDGFKEGKASLSFNAAAVYEDETDAPEQEIFYSLGWQLHNGILLPPATRGRAGRYWDINHLSPALAKKFYKVLRIRQAELNTKFPGIFKLLPEDEFLGLPATWTENEARRFYPESL